MKTLKELFTGKREREIVRDSGSTFVTGQLTQYICPMKCEGDKTYNAPGNCPDCNMRLVPVEDNKSSHAHHNHNHGCC